MVGVIILISVISVAYSVIQADKLKKAKYILALIFSILYGVMLFFVGMSMNTIIFYALAIIPLIAAVIHIIKHVNRKNN